MAHYTVRDTRTESIKVLGNVDEGHAYRKFADIQRMELNATHKEQRKGVNTIRRVATPTGFYELIKDGKVVSRFNLMVTYYALRGAPAGHEYDGTVADWQSGKFHR